MSRREQICAQYEEALFTLLMSEAAEWEGRRLLEENERLRCDPAAEVPEAVSARCRRVIQREFAKRNAAKIRRVFRKSFRGALAAVCAASILFTAAFAASETVRVCAVNLLIDVQEHFTAFRLRPASGTEPQPECPVFEIGWLPEGYEQKEPVFADGRYRSVSCTGPRGEALQITAGVLGEGGAVSFDTESSTSEDVILNGRTGTLYTKSYAGAGWPEYDRRGHYLLIVPIPEKMWVLSVLLTTDFNASDRETVLRIAENIAFDGLC